MKSIETVPEDIYNLFNGGPVDGTALRFVDEGNPTEQSLLQILEQRLAPRGERVEKGKLRFSKLGVPCERQLWWDINDPNGGEPLLPSTKLKFLFGDMLEQLLSHLVRAAGHKVEGVQDTLHFAGIEGHRDAVIDGVTVDFKSASTFSFAKFKSGLKKEEDAFGYLPQLRGYVAAAKNDPLVTDKNRGAFLVIDKQHGHVCVDIHTFSDEELEAHVEFVEHKKAVVASKRLPERGFSDEEDGKSGNRKLGTNCSYCSRKWECWPGLRAFNYAGKPRFLTRVSRRPADHIQELSPNEANEV